ncbi:uncharacterized protein LOC135845326 isoform X2 [Planococcus citri]|uniref:uncharacterized protein LOC135845326 isoform X2 n=1 Tax=Planococcus citri TaxID=170843 RepID=UPI0031FA2774
MESENEEKTVVQNKKSKGSGSCCSVASCKNTGRTKTMIRPELKFHRFPKDPDMRREWVRKCGRKERFNPDTGTVCSDHFIPEDYQRDLRAELLGLGDDKKRLLPDAVPHKNLPPEIQRKVRKRRDREPTEGEQLARRKKLVEEAFQWAESLSSGEIMQNELGFTTAQNVTLNSTTTPTKGNESNLNLSNATPKPKVVHQSDPKNVAQALLPSSKPASIEAAKSNEAARTSADASVSTAIAIDCSDISPTASPVNSPDEISTCDTNISKSKYSELLSNYEELDAKYKRCYKVLCCFKIAYAKVRSQNNSAKNKIIDLRQKNRDLQRRLKQLTNEKKSQKHKFVQTQSYPEKDTVEDDVTGWW